MISKTNSFALYGLEGRVVEVEADVTRGMPHFEIVGLPDAAVKESKERVRSAIKNSGRDFPIASITLNLAPADLKKEGTHFDLPIAAALLRAANQGLTRDIKDTVFIGELALDGDLRAISGVLPITLSAMQQGFKRIILPESNVKEARFVGGIEIIGLKNLNEVAEYLSGEEKPIAEHITYVPIKNTNRESGNLRFVKGQFAAKRAIEVAVSGGHNLLMVGSPGSGKTMLAKCVPSIMPDMSFEEALETTKIHSVAGLVDRDCGIVGERPFISPHHTATNVALIGGGQSLRPGLISLAHNGVLYLDEMPEYSRSALESLRQPLEDGVISVSRAKGSVRYPAGFILVGSMNPCPCGNYGSENIECRCTDTQIRKYKAKLSGPLLDRIDIQVQVDSVKYDDLVSSGEEESSETVRKRVNRARLVQRERFKNENFECNSQMTEKHFAIYCQLDKECSDLMRKSFESLGLSARARSRIFKVARTIADLDLSENINKKHLLEAIGYRSFDLNA